MTPNLADWLLETGVSSRPALFFRDRALTCAELRQQSGSLAAALQSRGFAPGDRIGLQADNSLFFAVSYLAILKAGFCCVPFPPGTDQNLFSAIRESTGMRCLLVQNKYLRSLPAAGLQVIAEDALATLPSASPTPVVPDPDNHLALLSFTSGSTGTPKAVMITHRNIQANTEDIIASLSLGAHDRVMAVLPLSYCFGLSLLHTHLRAGASVVLAGSFMFPEKVLDELADRECTGFAGVPSTYQILLRKTTFASRRFPALRWLQQAGGKLPAPLISELAEAQPAVRLFVMYGQTEATARLSCLDPAQLPARLGSIGRGLPGTRLEVIREDGTPVAPGSGETGEIVASGPNIAKGYWRSPDETARFFRDGRLYTGDLARVDEDGYIFIVDRARDFIKSAGNRISPQEVEEVLARHPDVLHAAVIGVPDDLLGEAVTAFVVPRPQAALTETELARHCNERLPNHKVPRFIYLRDTLPMNEFGKILKAKLRAAEPV